MKVVHELRRYDPLYVSVTCGVGVSAQERTENALDWIREETGLTVMSHLTCLGATKERMDTILRRYAQNGIDNILALRGDAPINVADFDVSEGEFRYAKDLVEFISGYKKFSIAVAVYPEGHFESPDAEKDMEYTKQKIDAGADFGITQMFFDNRYFYEFMKRADNAGIRIPILPGIMPITDCRKIEQFANFCNATIPREIRKNMEPYQDKPEETLKLGIDHAIAQCDDLLRSGVRHIHFYTMNKPDAVSGILNALPELIAITRQ